MSLLSPTILVELLRRAVEEPIGIWIGVTNTEQVIQKLGAKRLELGLKEELQICSPSIPNVIFLTRRSTELT